MNKFKNEKLPLTYLESVHRDGKIWGFTLFGAILAFPIIISIKLLVILTFL